MSKDVGWKIFDLGINGHKPPHQDRYFTAGVERDLPHWTPEHSHTLAVARAICNWKNEWEDKREWFKAWGPSSRL